MNNKKTKALLIAGLMAGLWPPLGAAQVLDSGATAWMLTSTSAEHENEGLGLVLHEDRGYSL